MQSDEESKRERSASSLRLDRADLGQKDKVDAASKMDSTKKLDQLKLNVLKTAVKGATSDKDDKTDMETKTLEEKVQEEKQTINKKENESGLIQKNAAQEQIQKEASYEQQQTGAE